MRDHLQSMNHDVATLKELGLQYLKNGDVLEKATELNRVVITFDKNFPSRQKQDNSSVIIIDIHPNFDSNIIHRIDPLLIKVNPSHLKNHLIIFSKDGVDIKN